jgi:hypothetical protein
MRERPVASGVDQTWPALVRRDTAERHVSGRVAAPAQDRAVGQPPTSRHAIALAHKCASTALWVCRPVGRQTLSLPASG